MNKSSSFESVANRFWNTVDNTLDALAIQDGTKSLTYSELDSRVNEIAATIGEARKGRPQAEPLVSLFIDHSATLVTAMMSALVSGCGYQPLDTGFPDERLQKILQTTQPLMILTTENYLERIKNLAGSKAQVVVISDQPPNVPVERNPVVVDALSPAYILSTSGTTNRRTERHFTPPKKLATCS